MFPSPLINSVYTAASFNLASHVRDTVLLACYLERIIQILRLRIRVRETVPEL